MDNDLPAPNPPATNNTEAYLAMLAGVEDLPMPSTINNNVEYYLRYLVENGGGGGGGGTTNYNQLSNKPKINSTTLSGNKSLDDLGIQAKIDAEHKLSADNVDDTSTTNKFVTASDKTTWNAKQDELVSGNNIKTINNESILGSGNITISGGSGGIADGINVADVDYDNKDLESTLKLEDGILTLNTEREGGTSTEEVVLNNAGTYSPLVVSRGTPVLEDLGGTRGYALKCFGNGTSQLLTQATAQRETKNHKFYGAFDVNCTSYTAGNICLMFSGADYGIITKKSTTNGWERVSDIITLANNPGNPTGNSTLFIGGAGDNGRSYNANCYIDNIMVVDLTNLFGSGSEPSKSDMDTAFGTFIDIVSGANTTTKLTDTALTVGGVNYSYKKIFTENNDCDVCTFDKVSYMKTIIVPSEQISIVLGSNGESPTRDETFELENLIRANQNRRNVAIQHIMDIALTFWEHREEFIYCSGTALDTPWDMWSTPGRHDINTGGYITAENAGYKCIDCSTFGRYVLNGIEYYSTPYYNTIENTTVVQGALTNGVETPSANNKICRTGKMYIRPGKKLKAETKNSSYTFNGIYGYNSSNVVVDTYNDFTNIVPSATVKYIRAEMTVTSASEYTSGNTFKYLRISENETPTYGAGIPTNKRNAYEMCNWLDDQGYSLNINQNIYDAADIPVGSPMFWGRNNSNNYKHIVHITINVGSKYQIHVFPNGLQHGKAIDIITHKQLIDHYDMLSAVCNTSLTNYVEPTS